MESLDDPSNDVLPRLVGESRDIPRQIPTTPLVPSWLTCKLISSTLHGTISPSQPAKARGGLMTTAPTNTVIFAVLLIASIMAAAAWVFRPPQPSAPPKPR